MCADEFDVDNVTWAFPPTRMKSGAAHTIPLAGRALAILEVMRACRVSDFVFAGQRLGRPISAHAFEKLVPAGATTHGFRSSFSDWCGETTNFAREDVERCLAHAVGNAVELAYRRGTAIEKRRQSMEAWSNYLDGYVTGNIIAIGGRK